MRLHEPDGHERRSSAARDQLVQAAWVIAGTDLARFAFLLGEDDGLQLFDTDQP